MQVCNISQILHDVKKTCETENKYTVTFIHKNKRLSAMRQGLQQKGFVARHMSIVV